MQATTSFDAREGRDYWWTLWRALTSDALLGALCALALFGLLAKLILPQQPANGTAAPVAYSRWEAEARSRQGALFSPLNSLGLNSIAQSPWWRLALAALIPLAGLRLADRLMGWRTAQRQDEPRLRVMLNGPPLSQFAERLRAQGYRVAQPAADLLVAQDGPRALAFACAFHGGLILAAGGLLLNLTLGWELPSQTVTANGPVNLAGGVSLALREGDDPAGVVVAFQPGDQRLVIGPGQTARAANGVALTLEQKLPGYRVRAIDSSGAALPIQASTFLSPSAELLLTLSPDEPERYLAIPKARLALALSAGGGNSRLRAYAIPSGQLLYDGEVAAEITIEKTTLRFQPATGAVISARYSPGDWLWPLGGVLLIVGLVGSVLFPHQRIVIHRQGEWTEFYATGRRVRQVIAGLVTDAQKA
jgi:hypothetical protein